MPRSAVTTPSVNDINARQRDFERSQRAARRSPWAPTGSHRPAGRLSRALRHAHRRAGDSAGARRGVHERAPRPTKPATACNRFRALQQFFKFAVEDEEINRSPVGRMQRPAVPVEPVPLSTEDLRALLAACAGKHFEDKRDSAIVRLFVDTGMRRAELLGLRGSDFDFDQDVALVMGKGNKGRACPFASKTGLALGRYLRLGTGHPFAASPAVWLGKKGPLTETGLTQMLWRRAEQAGIGTIHPHQFRHTFAHTWLAQGGNEATSSG